MGFVDMLPVAVLWSIPFLTDSRRTLTSPFFLFFPARLLPLAPRRARGHGPLLDLLFVFLTRNAVRTADFFQIPPSRVVELGAQVAF